MPWISPTGASGDWTNPERVYDNDVVSSSERSCSEDEWSSYLEITISAMDCDKVRFYAYYHGASQNSIYLDVYWSGEWHHIYEGIYTDRVWVEKSLGGSYSVTKARVKFYNDWPGISAVRIYEFDFNLKIFAPTTTTQAVSDILSITATGNGNITALGNENATKRGVCWNITGSPTVADNKSEEGGSFGTGAFTRPITGLSPGVKYYVKAYAYNSGGYGYGGEVNFTTDKVAPTVTTQSPTDILITTATGNGNITALGGENATVRGFKYGLTQVDTWSVSDSGSFSAGAYTKGLTGLSANTEYWIRAYATNSIGTSYGVWVQFQTLAPGTTPTGTTLNICSDYSGYTYQLHGAETDDGATYTGYFVLSTDLADKQGLPVKKRLLDLNLYFKKESSGSVNIYIKEDNEADWQDTGSVNLTGDEDIVVKHLPVDCLAKHYLIKISGANAFRFIGATLEHIPVGLR